MKGAAVKGGDLNSSPAGLRSASSSRESTTVAVGTGGPAAPFVKWAGGKRQLVPELLKHVPARFGGYFEPFVGGGAMFFELAGRGLLRYGAVLGDVNRALMRAYGAVRDEPEKLIGHLQWHAEKHSSEHFYATRTGEDKMTAAKLIYLNRTCFNGLYRVNRNGVFNVPMGRYTNPTICDADNIRACAAALREVTLVTGKFEVTCAGIEKGDFAYFDPPYWPVNETSNFTSYTAGGFGPEDQTALRDLAWKLRSCGVHVLLSNADVEPVRKLYAKFDVRRVEARRAINTRADKRGAVGELIIT